MTTQCATDSALWTVRPAFGVAGGPLEVVLSVEGNARAFSVGAQVRRGAASEALEALSMSDGYLTIRSGSRLNRTALGRFDQITWGYLRDLGFAVSFQDERGDGVRLTEHGQRAVQAGIAERLSLLDRCARAAGVQNARAA